MTHRKPAYCPYCGSELGEREFDGRRRAFCNSCREFVYQNPKPVARVVVLDGPRALFVKRGRPPHEGKWTVPGGVLEVDEPAAVAAARELDEETTISVSPEDLELLRTDFHVDDPDDGSILSICFAVERNRTDGTPSVGDEPIAVRFWDPQELLASDGETRSLELRCLEAAFDRLRNEERTFSRDGSR